MTVQVAKLRAPALSERTVEVLTKLVQVNIDSRDGLYAAAKNVRNTHLAALLAELARQRGEQAKELSSLIRAETHRTVAGSGTYVAAGHRAWMELKGAISRGNAHAILVEADRGESFLHRAYRDAVASTVGGEASDILVRHMIQVNETGARLRRLRQCTRH